MGKNVIWTMSALSDLKEIFDYLDYGANSIARVKIIAQSAKSLSAFPKAGRKLPEIPNDNYYELLVGNHRIIFKPNNDTSDIYILAIIHKRDLTSHL